MKPTTHLHLMPRIRMPGAIPPLTQHVFMARCLNKKEIQRWATGWTIGVLGFDSRRGLGIFLFTTALRTALGPTQPPIQWVQGALSLGGKATGGMKLTTHLHLVPKSRMRGAIPPLPQYAFMEWCSAKAQGQFYTYL
jgi:hypothetical protein